MKLRGLGGGLHRSDPGGTREQEDSLLSITQGQMTALEAVASHRFEDDMIAHLRDHAARLFKLRGEEAMRSHVRLGVTRASQHGFDLRGPVRLYLELMLALGTDFDTDPQHAWAQTHLVGSADIHQAVRAEQLYTAVRGYFDRVVGPESRYALLALKRTEQVDLDGALEGGGSFADRMAESLRFLYPQKYDFIGPQATGLLVRRAMAFSIERGMDGERGARIAVALMYGFGHGVFADPMYPWVRHTLDREEPMPDRLDRLVAKTRAYVAAMLAHLKSAQ